MVRQLHQQLTSCFYVPALEGQNVRWGGGRARLLHLHLGPRSRAIDRPPKFSENDAATLDQLVQSEGDYLSRRRWTLVSHQNVLLNPGKPFCNVFSVNIYPSSFLCFVLLLSK